VRASPVKTSIVVVAVAIAAALLLSTARAAQPPTSVRIGVLRAWLPPSVEPSTENGLRDGLSELGYIEGKNLTIETRLVDSSETYESGAADVIRSRVHLIVAIGTPAARAAMSATATIPIVFASGDPIVGGLVTNLAHPGANATGVSSLTTDLMAKRLQLLQQIAPRARRVILLVNRDNPLHPAIREETQKVAPTLGIQIVALDAGNQSRLDAALRGTQRSAGDALIVTSDGFFVSNRDKIAAAVRKAKLPALVPTKDYWSDGVLMSYGPSLKEMGRRAAAYVDKILKGAKTADLPIEQSSKFELRIDLRVARELDLKVPQDLLYRADEVIR